MTKLFCKIGDDGKLPIGTKETLARLIPQYAGKPLSIMLEETKDTASDRQRRYYFGVIVPAFQQYFADQGQRYDKDNLHDAMMRNIGGFNNPFVNPFTGEPDDGRKSYNDLTKAQAEGFHTLCRKWLAEKGVDCPEPNEEMYDYLNASRSNLVEPPASPAPISEQNKPASALSNPPEMCRRKHV